MGENNGKPLREKKPKEPPPTIGDELHGFLQYADALASTLPLLLLLMLAHCRVSGENFMRFLRANGDRLPDEEAESYALKPQFTREARRLARATHHADIGSDVLPRSFLVALVSQYDFFLGRLIRCLYRLRPEKINSSEKPFTFSQLLKFETIEDAREYILEKEVETVLRQSHAEQIEWLERKFEVTTLKKGLDIWPQFIEITERRNLFVHCHGVVSSQYQSVCMAHKVPVIAKLNTKLDVDLDYFIAAHRCFTEFAIKLAHVMWRVVAPVDRANADESMNDTLFELIGEERYEMAVKLGHFAVDTLLRHESTDKNHRMITLNLAQAYKWTNRQEDAMKIIGKADWSATGDVYQLALAVLRDDFPHAAKLMRKMGADGDVKATSYQNWPIFKEFRKSEPFLQAYEEVFKTPFVTIQRPAVLAPERIKAIQEATQALLGGEIEYMI